MRTVGQEARGEGGGRAGRAGGRGGERERKTNGLNETTAWCKHTAGSTRSIFKERKNKKKKKKDGKKKREKKGRKKREK